MIYKELTRKDFDNFIKDFDKKNKFKPIPLNNAAIEAIDLSIEEYICNYFKVDKGIKIKNPTKVL